MPRDHQADGTFLPNAIGTVLAQVTRPEVPDSRFPWRQLALPPF